MRALTFVAVVCGVAALSGNALRAAERSFDRGYVLARPAPQVPGTSDPTVSPEPPASELKVRNLRLDEPAVEVSRPAVILKFDLLNDSPSPLRAGTSSIVKALAARAPASPPTPIAVLVSRRRLETTAGPPERVHV